MQRSRRKRKLRAERRRKSNTRRSGQLPPYSRSDGRRIETLVARSLRREGGMRNMHITGDEVEQALSENICEGEGLLATGQAPKSCGSPLASLCCFWSYSSLSESH